MSNNRVKRIVLVGGGGHARSVLAVLKKLPEFSVIGYVDPVDHGKLLGIPYLGNDRVLNKLLKNHDCHSAVIGIGNVEVSEYRQKVFARLGSLGYEFPVIISPTAVINDEVKLGAGTVVLDCVVLNTSVRSGKACIFNTGSLVDHDCKLGDFVHVAPGVVVSGGVKVGRGTLLGTGCRIVQDVSIVQGCLIGAGAVVIKSIKKSGTYLGVPAKLAEEK